MIDVRQMLAWNDALRARWWERLEQMPPEFLASHVDASFLTPLGILTHMANVENAWMDVVEGQAPKWARHSTKAFAQLAPVRAYAEETRARTHAIVDDLDEAGLARACGPVEGPFARKTFTVEEILFTVATHECFHRGELLAVCWQKNIEPPVADYPSYGTPLHR